MDGIKKSITADYSPQPIYRQNLNKNKPAKNNSSEKSTVRTAQVIDEIKIALHKEGLGNYIDLLA